MTAISRTLCAVGLAVATACGSVVQEEPDGRPDASEFAEADDVPHDGRTDRRVEDGPVIDGETAPDTTDIGDAPDAAPPCDDPTDCDDGEPCNGAETCNDDVCTPGSSQADGTPCRTEDVTGSCVDGWCVPPSCPDGDVDEEQGEECDDGGSDAGDGCEPNCRFSCHADEHCNDSDSCTDDRCETNSRGKLCTHSALPDWYYDADGDNYGDPTRSVCENEQPDGHVDNDEDCCDQESSIDPQVNPEHSNFETTSYRCGDSTSESYDWNCDGVEQLERTDLAIGTCHYDSSSLTCTGITPGWCTSEMTPADASYTCGRVPGCGETGGWVSGCRTALEPRLDGGTGPETHLDAVIDIADGGTTDAGSPLCQPAIAATVQRCR